MPNLLLVQNLNPGNSDSLWKEGLNKILTTENLWRQSHHPIWSTLLSSSDSWGLIILSGVSKWKQSYQHQGHCSLPLNRRRQQKMCQCQRAMRVQKGNRCTNDSSSSVGPVMMKWKGGKNKNKKLDTLSNVPMLPLSKIGGENDVPSINEILQFFI